MDDSVRTFRKRKGQRGTSMIETVMVLVVLMLILFGLTQIVHLYMHKMVANHGAFVTARSYIVGFEDRIVRRAKEVGTIGLAGPMTAPYSNLSYVEQGALDEIMIEDFLITEGYTMRYTYWPNVGLNMPSSDSEGVQRMRIHVNNYPLQMPLTELITNEDDVDFSAEANLYNHAGYYLE